MARFSVRWMLGLVLVTVASGQDPQAEFRAEIWIPDESPQALTIVDDLLYLGGLEHVGPYSGPFAVVDPDTGTFDPLTGKVSGEVMAAVPDGSGGWYIGGDFGSIGDVERSSLAHILADGSVGPWNPGGGGEVLALLLDGTTLYAGGHFQGFGGEDRENLAALDAVTGELLPWNPDIDWASDQHVRALLKTGSTLYVGGFFDGFSIGGALRRHLAALDTTTAIAEAWNPDPNGTVTSFVLSGDTLYIGGGFSTIGGAARDGAAEVDMTTGLAGAWDPDASSAVLAMALEGSTMYLGGHFTTLGGAPRNYIGAVDIVGGAVLPWDPDAGGSDGSSTRVASIDVADGVVYVGGSFTMIGGANRAHLAILDPQTGEATDFDVPAINGLEASYVNAVRASDTGLGVSGHFHILGGEARAEIAAIDLLSGELTPWAPSVAGAVQEILVDGDTVYVGGSFAEVNGQKHLCLVALDVDTGDVIESFSPDIQELTGLCFVRALARHGSTLYVGGRFATDDPAQRNIVALDAVTGQRVDGWLSSAGNVVEDIAVSEDGTVVYLGGLFGDVGVDFIPRSRLAALDALTGAPTDWNPGANNEVRGLTISGSTVYACGQFLLLGGEVRRHIGAIDATGLVTSWDPSIDGAGTTWVAKLAHTDTSIFAAGRYSTVGEGFSPDIASIDRQSGLLRDWIGGAAGSDIIELTLNDSWLAVGGSFSKMNGNVRLHLAVFPFTGCPWDLNGDGTVNVPDLLLLLGDFGTCNGSPADFDGDGCVTVSDLLTLIFNFGPCPDGGCPWDVNGDETVDHSDLRQVLGNMGPCDGCPEDVDGDGVVDFEDVIAVATHFGPCP